MIDSPTYNNVMTQLNEAIEFFLKTGFFIAESPKTDPQADYTTRRKQYKANSPELPNIWVRKLVRKIAKELKRPIIIAKTEWYPDPEGVIVVKLKRLKRNAPLMSTFFLVEQYDGFYYQMRQRTDKHPETFRWKSCATEWVLIFIGTEGREQFDDWMTYIQNSPECRKALKIPEPKGEADGADLLPRRNQDRLQGQAKRQALPEGAAPDDARSAGDCELAG